MKFFFAICVFVFPFLLLSAQANSLIITHIKIEGNTKTKSAVIHREIGANVGDTISRPTQFASTIQNRLSGLALFTWVHVQWVKDTLQILVKEKVYIWGMPRLTWADRNFTVWSATAEPDRLDYGATIFFNNIAGNNIRAYITAIAGYNQLLEAALQTPFNKHDKGWSFGVYGKYLTNHELWYATKDNKVSFLNIEDKRIQKNASIIVFQKRRFSYHNHIEFAEGISKFQIDSLAFLANPFYLHSTVKQREIFVGSDFVSDYRNQRDYPTNGYYLRTGMRVGIAKANAENTPFFSAHVKVSKFTLIAIKHNIVFASSFSARYTYFPNTYLYQRQLGYSSDYVRGYEPYVIDGAGYVLGKLGLRKPLISNKIVKIKSGKWLNSYRYIPISAWFNIFADAGAAFMPSSKMPFQETNTMQGKLLSGTGIGIDILAWYTAMARFEYSFNRMGQGFFNISFKNAF